jgi:predicted TIM-barrel fold metal-dependent hydrolase
MDAMRQEVPIHCAKIYRIEPLIADLLKQDLSWGEFSEAFDLAIETALTTGGYVGLKSVIAYRTGLDVSPLSRTPDQGYQALDAIKRGTGGGAVKKLRDHLLCRSLELCMEHKVPMQIHTGMGDYEVNLVLASPAYLLDLLRFPVYRGCNVILVHMGYPYHREAGYMAQVLPRVYCDISEGVPFAGSGAGAILREILEMAPLNKVMYGSDAYTVPEGIYASAKIGKRIVTTVMNNLVAEDVLTEADAQKVGEMILGETTKRIYNL